MNRNANLKTTVRRCLVALCALAAISILSACNAQADSAKSERPATKIPFGKEISLTIYGYNYTNRYIDSFSVDGAGGGNLYVSSPNGSGGGSVCCTPYIIGLRDFTVKVRWQSGGCKYAEKENNSNYVYYRTYPFFKEAVVKVDPNISENPRYFEVHFYPDGHVEAAITEQSSEPRLKLKEDREDNTSYPRCPNDQKPNQ